jgi:hypothetical protein
MRSDQQEGSRHARLGKRQTATMRCRSSAKTVQLPLANANTPERLARKHARAFRNGFAGWLSENVSVYGAFETTAVGLWQRGRLHYSARTIVEALRHQSLVAEEQCLFKLDNDHTPDMARLFLIRFPECEGFFTFRGRPIR